jgi:gas vesicle protein
VTGVLAGTIAALLMAPQSGSRTRRMLREKAEDGAQSVVDAGHQWRRQGKRLAQSATSLADRAKYAMSG